MGESCLSATEAQRPEVPEAVRLHLEKISRALGKSDASRKLLNYLAQRSLGGDLPKEMDIALDVFGKDATFTGADDAVVRVQVRSLRQKLDEYYRGPGKDEALRVQIPKGGYRLVIAEHQPGEATPASTLAATPLGQDYRRIATGATGVAAVCLIALLVSLLHRPEAVTTTDDTASVRQSFIWADLLASKRPLTIVLGDLVLFAQRDPADGHEQYVRDLTVNTDQQLQGYIARHPNSPGLGLTQTTHLPKSVAYGLADILPVVSDRRRRISVTILDELRLEDLRDNDIIYIGPLVRLGALADQYFQLSRFQYDESTLRLTDRESGKIFGLQGNQQNVTDFGLFAKFQGPSNNHILVFASVARDVGLLQIARSLSTLEGVTAVRSRLAPGPAEGPSSLEVLMAVSGYRRTDRTAEIVDAPALNPRKPK